MKISVVVPSYNQGSFLKETLESVLNQKHSDTEIIVIDGGSTDNSIDIIKELEQHITYWVSEPDNGQSHAINKGFKQCTGDIVCWLNSDDLFTKDTIPEVISIFKQNQNLDFILGETQMFENTGTLPSKHINPDHFDNQMLAGVVTAQPSYFFKRNFLEKVGYLNEALHFGMDYDLFLRMTLRGNYQYFNRVWSKYRLHNESKSETSHAKFASEWRNIFYSLLIDTHNLDLASYWSNVFTGLETTKTVKYGSAMPKGTDMKLTVGFALYHQAVFFNQGGNLKFASNLLAILKRDFPAVYNHYNVGAYYWKLKVKRLFQ